MNEDKYIININMPIGRKDLISEIKSLKKATAPTPAPDPVSEGFTLSSLKKKKKDKKNKKGKALEAELMSAGEVTITNEDEEPTDDNNDDISSLLDMDEIFREDEDDSIDDGIINEQRRGYDKLKKEDNQYKKEFAEELTLLYNLLDEINKFGKKLEKKYEGLDNSKTRGVSKYINDLIASIISSKQSKLNVLKEISGIKKTIADLKIKTDAKSKDNSPGGAASMDYLAASYLQNVLKYGRNNFLRDFGAVKSADDDDDDDDFPTMNKPSNMYTDSYIPPDYDRYNKIIDERLSETENPYRSDDGDRYIEYEHRGVKIWIKKCIDTGEWEFVALDKDQIQIYDYPIPTRRDTGKIKFSDDGRYATDERGRSYKVFEYYSES